MILVGIKGLRLFDNLIAFLVSDSDIYLQQFIVENLICFNFCQSSFRSSEPLVDLLLQMSNKLSESASWRGRQGMALMLKLVISLKVMTKIARFFIEREKNHCYPIRACYLQRLDVAVERGLILGFIRSWDQGVKYWIPVMVCGGLRLWDPSVGFAWFWAS